MPKVDKTTSSHRASISTASAAGSRSSSWAAKDDETLISARAKGLNWNQIAPKHFPAKSPNACRKRHERLMERRNAAQWDGVKLNELAQAYMKVRREMWSLLAAEVGEKWTLVEQKCMEKGLKNLAQAYRSGQKKASSYDGQDDSGFGHSDFDEESRDGHADLPEAPEANFFPTSYSNPQQRVPSIQSMVHPHPVHYNTRQMQPHPQQHQ
ncbi:hypothetical protein BDV95DRAFT_503422 [Massariosphaeria phaeospora]|uniref:Myb-like domain-containing protein n=1 Tax=Massariosphaeria phaeospora TaxID=100035 RepID=A0A7C8I3M0_9PLEO|nr:hypothetical protein BDV95DRAFT_503422 [Massariosphaeria phaeospora]